MAKAENVVEAVRADYKTATDSSAKIKDIISVDTLLSDKCNLLYNHKLLKKRKLLGFGKTDDYIQKFDEQQFRLRVNLDTIEQKCSESTIAPDIDFQTTKLLKRYTEFFQKGLEVYREANNTTCPFCHRDWPEAKIIVNKYSMFLESEYSRKRNDILSFIKQIERYKDQIENQIGLVSRTLKDTLPKAQKYDVDISDWLPLKYNQEKHDEAIGKLKEKYNNMVQPVSIKNVLLELQQVHLDIIINNNLILKNIGKGIQTISNQRKSINRQLVEHFAKKMWIDNQSLREEIKKIQKLKTDNERNIEHLETQSPPKDTVNDVFNKLLKFIGLDEYYIDENRRLKIRIDKDYDISSEGKRISSAQRKIISLCYFFAEIISEIDSVNKLRNYILIFDDPVDSADYIYFHSITTVIEKAEIILAKLLGVNKLKFGQFFVLTHNSLLHDRLACNWKEFGRTIRKINGLTTLCPPTKTINNYNEYIRSICEYYRNPVSQKARMIHIGNIIRRVMEILASFDSLGTNKFQGLLDGMGKTKLSILANHLSHESFTRVLNPLSTPSELKEACGDILEVIKDRHPWQYKTIKERYGITLPL